MITEVMKDLKAVGGTVRYSVNSEREIEVAGRHLEFSTPGLVSTWELSFVENTEKNIYNRMIDEFDEDDVFFDIGANIGFYTCLFAGKASQVYSFEPNKNTVKLLRENVERNSLNNVKIMEMALSDENGYKGLRKAPGSTVTGMAKVKEDESGGIEARTVDSLLEEEEVELPDMIKIDIEGHEKKALRGMENLLEKASPVIYIESHGNHGELEQMFEEYGYSCEKLNRRIEGNIFYRAEPV